MDFQSQSDGLTASIMTRGFTGQQKQVEYNKSHHKGRKNWT